MTLDILLATHNGESFIEAQIASLLDQDCSDFVIHVRDDGSADATPRILETLSRRHAGKIRIAGRSPRATGVVECFSTLLQQARADYIMFCDQDDVWLPSKITRSMNRMERLEAIHGKDTPILIHTDLAVVDASLRRISDSFAGYQRMHMQHDGLNRLLVKNIVTGCTMTINRALHRRLGNGFPPDVRMHDWWVALIASLFGIIDYIDEPTVLYRQHPHNAVGTRPIRMKRVRSLRYSILSYMEDIRATFRQADRLLQCYGPSMKRSDRQVCLDFLGLADRQPAGRILTLLRRRFFSHGWLRNIGFVLIVTAMRNRQPALAVWP